MKINLGPLEFTRDFCKQYVDLIREGIVGVAALQDALNRTLTEKLKEAPEVGHRCRKKTFGGTYKCDHVQSMWSTPKERDTHRAHLVWIEKLGEE